MMNEELHPDDLYDEEGMPEDLDPADLMDALGGDDDRDYYDPDDDDEQEDDDDMIAISREKHDAIIQLLEVLVRSHETLKAKIESQDEVIESLKARLD